MPGILDLLTGQSGGGSLLDFLRANALNPNLNVGGGLPSDVANYGQAPGPMPPMSLAGPRAAPDAPPAAPPAIIGANQPSPLDGAQWPAGPVGAPSSANASLSMGPKPAPMSFVAPPAPVAPPPVAASSPGLGDRLSLGVKGMLGNIGLGPIGAIAGGLGAAVSGSPTDPATIELQKTAKLQNATATALIAKGADPVSVQAAMQSPELMKALITQHYGPQTVQALGNGYVADKNGNVRRAYEPDDKFKVQQTGEDGMGRKTFQLFNPADGTIKPLPGAAAGADAGGGLGDTSKTGAEYLATVPPAQRGTVQGMIDGTIQPPTSMAAAKPYWQAMIAAAKQADPTFDESNWAARRKMRVDIASSVNSSMGGILANGKSAFEHLKTYSDKLADVGNYNGPDVPGGALLADAGNFVGNRMLPTAGTRDKIAGANSAGLKYGQESTKFYAGSGGGAEERMSALHSNDARSTTAAAQAGFLQTEKELMLGRLQEKEKQIRDTLGDVYLQQHPVVTPDLQRTVAAIDANIAKLRGTAAPAARASGAVTGKTSSGISWSVQ